MTFVAGFNCTDGFVLCADQLETDGVTKRYRCKLEAHQVSDEWGIVWGGSGTADVVDKFSDYFRPHITGDSFDSYKIRNNLDTCLTLIHQDHPLDGIAIVAGVYGRPLNKDPQPFLGIPENYVYRGRSSTQCVAVEKEFTIAGMDVTLAQFVLRNTYTRLMPIDQAVRLGIFVTSLMKEYADGVGGDTNVITHTHGSQFMKNYDPGEIKKIEKEIPLGDFNWLMTNFWWTKNPVSDGSFMDHLRKSIAKRSKRK